MPTRSTSTIILSENTKTGKKNVCDLITSFSVNVVFSRRNGEITESEKSMSNQTCDIQ